MPWSGGSFSRTNGSNTGTTVWQQDEAGAVDIEADRHDTHDQDLADGINACLAKDGSNAMTGNLNLNGNSFDNASAPVNFTETDPVDLTDAGNALSVGGATSSTHLAMSAAIIQAKSDASTATNLGIQTLGGNLTLGDSSSTITIPGALAVTIKDALQKYKSADTSRTSTSTFADDPHLAGFSLEASSYYKIEGYFDLNISSAAVGFKAWLEFSSAFSDIGVTMQAYDGEGNYSQLSDSATDYPFIAYGSIAAKGAVMTGYVLTNGAATVDFQWAQFTSNANAVLLGRGSWLRFEKLS